MLDMTSAFHGDLSPQTALKIAKHHLETAHNSMDPETIRIFNGEARRALLRMGQPTLEEILRSNAGLDPYLCEETRPFAAELYELLNSLNQKDNE